MDSIERSAIGHEFTPSTDTFVPADTGSTEPLAGGERVGKVDGMGNITPVAGNTQDQPARPQKSEQVLPPQLEEMRRNMQADYTRKTQSLAEERRQLQAERQQMTELLRTVAQSQSIQQQPMTPQQRSLLDRLPASVRENLDAQSAGVFETLGALIHETVQEQMTVMNNQLTQTLQQTLTPLQQQVRHDRLDREWQQLGAQYGANNLVPHSERVAQMLASNPNLTASQALNMVAPEVVQQHYITLGRQQALREAQQQHSAADLYDGGSPSARPVQEFRPGESMQDTVRRLYGQSQELDPETRQAMRAYIERE